MRSNGSSYRFVFTVLGAFSALATMGHAEEAKGIRLAGVRAEFVEQPSVLSAEGALTGTGDEGAAGGTVAGIASECESVGAWELLPPLSGSSRFRGNAYTITSDVSLVEFGVELQIADGTLADVEFAIYVKEVGGPWVQTFTATQTFMGTGSRSMLRSGVIDPPLGLLTGVQYAIGAGWGAQTISYNQDLASYPQAFAIGTIDGRVGRNSVTAPLPVEFLQLGINNNAYSMELCVTGACCLPDGTCENTTLANCLGQSGEFAAAGVACAAVEPCPLTRGACCLSSGACVFVNEFACGDLGGSWNETVACDDPTEPCAPRGGCCLSDGSCLDNVTRTVCAANSGTYRGDDVTCSAFPPCTAGGCCFVESCVLVVTEGDCLLSGGIFEGRGTSCDGNPCATTGACCQGETCSEMSQVNCTALGGIYHGDDTNCATLPVPCGKGACCVPGSGCTDAGGAGVTQSFCTNILSGTYSNGNSCTTIEPRCPGTCCAFGTDFCVDDVLPTECVTKATGFFIGYATVCDPTGVVNVCEMVSATGSCCVGDGRCVDVDSETTCTDALSGTYSAASCGTGSCISIPTGACCDRLALTCGEGIEQANCTGEWTEGKTCGELSPICEERGACCDRATLTCVNSTVQGPCEAGGGEWSQGLLCDEVTPPCAPTGACCQNNGADCSVTSEFLCSDAGGAYRGDATTCQDALICNLGACCQRDGTCQDDVLDVDCMPNEGAPAPEFFAGLACANVCVARGACCVDADCRITTLLECDNAGGTYSGVGSDCVTDFCVVGACCIRGVGDNCVQLTGQDCENELGVYLGPGGDCSAPGACDRGSCCGAGGNANNACTDDTIQGACDTSEDFRLGGSCNTCIARGACCLPQGSCAVMERLTCLNLGGVYNGDATVCDSFDLCRDGACCFQDATCTIDTRQECEPAGGTYVGAGTTCVADICIGTGGCCINGTCMPDQTATECNMANGVFLGVGSDCSDATACTTEGACCDENTGTCINGVLQVECGAGTWTGGALCTQVACDEPGACCDPNNRTCTDGVVGADCTGIDTSWTRLTACNQLDPACQFAPTGSCCNNTTFVCNDGIVAFYCNGVDETWTEGVRCRDLGSACTAPETGACCETGTCTTQTPENCALLSGTYLGADSICDGTCDIGACCQVNGTCTDDVLRLECTQTDATCSVDTTCATAGCVATGACCVPVCSDLSSTECAAQGGNYDVSNPIGTCCFASTCSDGTLADCDAVSGTYGGDGSACESATCLTGACCSGDSGCVTTLTKLECEVGYGTFLDAGATCDGVTCPTGACCTGNSGCTESLSAAACEANGDTFEGVGSTCDTGVCNSGCCCGVDGVFRNGALASECNEPGDRFEAGLCSNLDPLCQIRGACCLPDEVDSCRLLTETDCIAFGAGASYAGDGTTCDAGNLCEVGACCTGETCSAVKRLDCAAGTYLGVGTVCGTDTCSIGGCCRDNAVCNDLPQFECDPVGIFLGAGVPCDADRQCGSGACCTGETCTEARLFDCTTGTHLGTGTTCTPGDLCAVGGCCQDNDLCEDLPQYECNDLGVFLGASAFCAVGACDLCNPGIVSSDPASCLIDARYPHDPTDPAALLGWDSITLTLSCEPNDITAADFVVELTPNDATAPGIAGVVLDVTTVTITFDSVIPAGHWTCVTHTASGTMACLGSLPADVNSDGTASPSDILDLIDGLNGISGPLGLNQCDVDRSNACGPADILAVIDLLNGSSMFQVWNGEALSACPAAP